MTEICSLLWNPSLWQWSAAELPGPGASEEDFSLQFELPEVAPSPVSGVSPPPHNPVFGSLEPVLFYIVFGTILGTLRQGFLSVAWPDLDSFWELFGIIFFRLFRIFMEKWKLCSRTSESLIFEVGRASETSFLGICFCEHFKKPWECRLQTLNNLKKN